MATITEVGVSVVVELAWIPNSTGEYSVIVRAVSFDDMGNTVRQQRIDITDRLSANQIAAAGNVVDTVTNYIKQMWGIS